MQCGGGDGGGGEELSQAHPQLDHGGKGLRGRRLPCLGRALGGHCHCLRLAVCWALLGDRGPSGQPVPKLICTETLLERSGERGHVI